MSERVPPDVLCDPKGQERTLLQSFGMSVCITHVAQGCGIAPISLLCTSMEFFLLFWETVVVVSVAHCQLGSGKLTFHLFELGLEAS